MNALNPIIILVTALLVVFLESAFSGVRNVLGAQIDLLPALMVYVSLTAGFSTILAFAVIGGLCFDSLSANPPGVSIVPLLGIGLFYYWNREIVVRDQPFAQVVLGLIACGLTPLVTLLLLLSMGRAPIVGWGSLWQWLAMTVGGAVFVPVFFKLFELIQRALEYAPLPESTFRRDREIKRGKL
ncbi:MAG: hypothetical protein AB1705_13115 [Verrucomicrobiota bacterium]